MESGTSRRIAGEREKEARFDHEKRLTFWTVSCDVARELRALL
jgi:hypothetical protein